MLFEQQPDSNQNEAQANETEQQYFIPNKDDGSFSQWMLTPEEIIEKLEHNLKGEIKRGDKWVKSGKRWMNDDGIKCIVSIVDSVVNKITFTTKMSDNEIDSEIDHLDMELIDLLSLKYDEFDVDVESLGMLREMIIKIVFPAMKKGEGGWTIESMGKSWSMREVIANGANAAPEKKKGIFSLFSGR